MERQKNIKLLVATGLYPPDIGGPATYSKMLEEKLEAHNVKTSIVQFGSVRHLPKGVRHVVFFFLLLKKMRGVDVVYALDPISVGVPARLVAFLMRKKFIVRLGGDYAWEQGQQRFDLVENLDQYTRNPKDAAWQVRLLAYIQKRIVKSATFVVLPSEYLKSIVVTWGILPSKIQVIYSALFPLQVEGSKSAIRQQLAYEGTVLVSAGRLVPWKGFGELIEVVASLVPLIPDISLVIVGDGPLHTELVDTVKVHNLEDRVRLVGRLSKEALGAAIKGADIFVLNTAYEGLSHQLLEVMDLSIPIITTNIGGNPELITDGMGGMLVPVGDKEELAKVITHLVANEQSRIRLAQNARLRTQDFTQEAVVEKLATFLHTEVVIEK